MINRFYQLKPDQYYISIEPKGNLDYEKSFWGEIIDPDGIKRNRITERDKYLEDLTKELTFINSIKPGEILDVGCGLGYLLSGVNSNWVKYGIEISAKLRRDLIF